MGNVAAQELRRVDDTELIQLLTGESNVVVLFSKYINIYILIDEVQPTWAYVDMFVYAPATGHLFMVNICT